MPPRRRPGAAPGAPHEAFAWAFDAALRQHDPNVSALLRGLRAQGLQLDRETFRRWRTGQDRPEHVRSLAVLATLERRWAYPDGYFRKLLPVSERALSAIPAPEMSPSERRRYLCHLPGDFHLRSPAQRAEIMAWIRRTFRPQDRPFHSYLVHATASPYGIRFPEHQAALRGQCAEPRRLRSGNRRAPPRLSEELGDLLAFKTVPFAAGVLRNGVWSPATARLKIEQVGLIFGALAGDPRGPELGFGAPLESLTFALFVLPDVLDAFLTWRRRRRGFFTVTERDIARSVAALAHPKYGWLIQSPFLAERLVPIDGLASASAVAAARADWAGACARMNEFARMRGDELGRVTRRHRDPFEPILPVLEADRPVAVYRRIAEEIRARRPDPRHDPRAAAENARAYLMVRLALHLGFRQRTLRELRVPRDKAEPTPLSVLEAARCGELRWRRDIGGWEVVAPTTAFKNDRSSYFLGRPFRLVLPDVAGLYREIEAYLGRHRPILIGEGLDPGVFFVMSARARRPARAMDMDDFYLAWRGLIERYGIYNPYTGRGAIPGLLPHGPHAVRDVLATHVLKLTGSYEQAGFAIQDTAKSIELHYGRFLPQDKANQVTRLLDQVWREDTCGPGFPEAHGDPNALW